MKEPMVVSIRVPLTTLIALSGRSDDRAHFTFDGDLVTLGTIEAFLRMAGFPVVKQDVRPGFRQEDEQLYVVALQLIWGQRIPGWWCQEHELIERGICTRQQFQDALTAHLAGTDNGSAP